MPANHAPRDVWVVGRLVLPDLSSNAGWSPWRGRRLLGRVTSTHLRGALVWDGATVLAAPGWGWFVGPVARH